MTSPFLRRKARQYAVQGLYQWQMTEAPIEEIIAEFIADNSPKKFDVTYFQEILYGVIIQLARVDESLQPHAKDRTLKSLDPIELAILRLATFELLFKLDVPYRVIINEAVELAKRFGATDGHKFVNGVLDHLAQDLRSVEAANKK
jgi:N utilization substance protein B